MFDIAHTVQNYMQCSIVEVLNMSLPQFWDLAVYAINRANEEQENKENKTEIVFVPATKSIAETGLY